MLTKIPPRTFTEHWARTTQTPLMNTSTRPPHDGNFKSLETLAANCFTHHHHHHPDAPKGMEEVEEEAEEAEEVEDYLLRLDQACFHRMDGHPTLTSSWVANQKCSQEIE
jgi:hypothetical protein